MSDEHRTVPVNMGVELWPEPTENPADRSTLAVYRVDLDKLNRFRETRNAYLAARAAIVGELERHGWRAPARTASRWLDVVCTAKPGSADDPPAIFVDLAVDQGRSVDFGEWVDRGEYVALRIPMGE
jgi:hypothetical protein